MARRSPSTEVREQRSVFYFTPEGAGELPRPFGEMYPHMFMQDVSQNLIPASARRRDKLAVEILPANEQVEKMLTRALDISHQSYSHRDMERALSEFLRLTMVELCLAPRVVFEIVYLRPKAGEPPVAFELFLVNARQIVERRGHLFQTVPAEIARERKVDELISLPPENLAVFTLPSELARPVASAMQALSALSDHRWHTLALDAQKQRLPYDFSIHERSMKLALAEALRAIGWTARGSFNDKVINYYWLRQELRFKLFELAVREALVGQLNTVLQRVGAVLGWSAQLSISGLPGRTDLERALDQLASGAAPFTEIMDSIRGY
jgi:hypothetical protein